MTNLLVAPINLNNYKELLDKEIDGFIFGIKNLSVFLNFDITIKELEEILENNNKKIYIAINKLMYNEDLVYLKETLIKLNKMNISGIIFEDLAVFNIVKENKLDINLIYNQIHLGTNSDSCNYWKDKGINGVILSTELMLKDYIDIKKNTNMNIMVNIYGYIPIFYSSRELITNYFKFIDKKKEEDIYNIYNTTTNKKYIIYEKNSASFIYNEILNGINEVKELITNNIDYLILNGLMHNESDFNLIVDKYIKAINKEDIDQLEIHNTGFLYKETIYKVKS